MKRLRILALPCLLLLAAGCSRTLHPADDTLLRNFAAHEADFERLVRMIREDRKLERVDDTWTRPDDPSSIGIKAERIDAYRSLFRTLGIPRGFYAFHDPERITFIASAGGLGVGGSAKGYAHLVEKPDLVVENLDTFHSPDGRSFTAFRHIKDGWYLYLDYED